MLSEVVMCNCVRNPGGAREIEPETFRRRGQLLSRPPTTGPIVLVSLCQWLFVVCPGRLAMQLFLRAASGYDPAKAVLLAAFPSDHTWCSGRRM